MFFAIYLLFVTSSLLTVCISRDMILPTFFELHFSFVRTGLELPTFLALPLPLPL